MMDAGRSHQVEIAVKSLALPMAVWIGSAGEILADDFSERNPAVEAGHNNGSSVGLGCFAPGPSDPRWPGILRDFPWLAPALEAPPKPGFCGVSDGLSDRMDRLRALGNAVVPQIPELIGRAIGASL